MISVVLLVIATALTGFMGGLTAVTSSAPEDLVPVVLIGVLRPPPQDFRGSE